MARPVELRDIGEFALIERLRKTFRPLPTGMTGPGDDCGVVDLDTLYHTGSQLLVSTDTLVANRHFIPSETGAEDVGWKLLAVSLSDIAAMGGTARFATLSFQFPAETKLGWIEELTRGINEAATAFDTLILGGNCTEAAEISLTATVLGTADRPLFRNGAQPGDSLWMSGSIGLAHAGLLLETGQTQAELSAQERARVTQAYRRPQPRLSLGRALANSGQVTSLIDVSDGLLQDAAQLALASGVAITIDLRLFPPCELLSRLSISPLQAATGGGDYELLFSAKGDPAGSLETDGVEVGIVRIGEVWAGSPGISVIDGEGIRYSLQDILDRSGLGTAGFEHFHK